MSHFDQLCVYVLAQIFQVFKVKFNPNQVIKYRAIYESHTRKFFYMEDNLQQSQAPVLWTFWIFICGFQSFFCVNTCCLGQITIIPEQWILCQWMFLHSLFHRNECFFSQCLIVFVNLQRRMSWAQTDASNRMKNRR